jgi:hypothetical protein
MLSDARARLAQEQARLVESLTAGGVAPPGFDLDRVAIAARSLVRKRARGVARLWPALAKSLGERFEDHFARYAVSQSQPVGGYLEDGERFAEWMMCEGALPDAGRREWLARRAMRGWPIRIGRGEAGGQMVALRIWRRGVRVWQVAPH